MSERDPLDVIDMRTRVSRRKLLGGIGALGVMLASPIWRPGRRLCTG